MVLVKGQSEDREDSIGRPSGRQHRWSNSGGSGSTEFSGHWPCRQAMLSRTPGGYNRNSCPFRGACSLNQV
eukprot:15465421-Alexandrium_andersonii.AAC.1